MDPTSTSSGSSPNQAFYNLSLLIIFGVLLYYVLFGKSRGRKNKINYPPEPFHFGPLGHWPHFLLTVPNKFLRFLMNQKKQLGKVMQLRLGGLPVVFIQDVHVLKDSFREKSVSGRPPFEPLQIYKERRGFAMNDGDEAKEVQQFTVNTLKEFGMGKSVFGQVISEQVENLMSLLRTKLDKPISTQGIFYPTAFNIIWHIVSRQNISMDDDQVERFFETTTRMNDQSKAMILATIFPGLWKWIPFGTRELKRGMAHTKALFDNFIRIRRANYKLGDEFDFTDAFFKRIHSTTNESSAFYGEAAYEHAAEAIKELFLGGTETTSTTLSWLFLFLALHPEKQGKLQEEIDRVLKGQIPTLLDKRRLPYVEAVVNETLRKGCVLPLGLPHMTREDTNIGGYDVSKKSIVVANIYGIHHSEETWGDPENFRPERFLNEDETSLVKHDAFIPFSTGRRACPGEKLSKDSLFIHVTRIFQEFSVNLNPDEKRPTMYAKIKTAMVPLPHTVIVRKRKPLFTFMNCE